MAPTLYGVLMFLFGLFVSGQGIIYMAVIATLFAATAVAYALGGANITPAMLAQGFVGLSLMRKEGLRGFLSPIRFATPPFWLLLLTVWAVISAFVFPRLFEGQIMVAGFDRESGIDGGLMRIKPVSLNITQALYAFLAFMTFVMMRTLLARPGAVRTIARAMLWVAGLNVIAASTGLAQHHLGLPPILEYLKNANYTMMGGEVAGLVRVTGTFSETSMFSQYTLAIIAFTHVLWFNGMYRGWARFLTLANLVLLMISTSGTAYVGLAICMAVALGFAFWKLFREGSMGSQALYVQLAAVGFCLAVAVVLFVPHAFEAVQEYFGIVIGKKLTSTSGYVRSSLNGYAWQTFLDTFGMGAGLGCCRASSFALVIISNLGWIGVALFITFVWPLLFGKKPNWVPSETWVIAQAARCAVFAALVCALLVGLVYDLGFLFYITAALAYVPKLPPDEQPAHSTT